MIFQEWRRFYTIGSILLRHGLDELIPRQWQPLPVRLLRRSLFCLRNRYPHLSRGARLRQAFETLGPVFIKFGQMLSTRRDLLPPDIAEELAEFIRGAELIIHNAPFDIGFLNAEFDRLGFVPVGTLCHGVIDTLKMAKEIHPGKRNSLDALCERYEIDNSSRTLHGALLDTELLADVYLAMTRGQNSLMIDVDTAPQPQLGADGQVRQRKPLQVRRASEAELAEHDRVLAAIDKESKGACIWLPKAETPAT